MPMQVNGVGVISGSDPVQVDILQFSGSGAIVRVSQSDNMMVVSTTVNPQAPIAAANGWPTYATDDGWMANVTSSTCPASGMYMEISGSPIFPDSLTWYTNSNKVTKVREELVVERNSSNFPTVEQFNYFISGVTGFWDKITYTSNVFEASRVRTKGWFGPMPILSSSDFPANFKQSYFATNYCSASSEVNASLQKTNSSSWIVSGTLPISVAQTYQQYLPAITGWSSANFLSSTYDTSTDAQYNADNKMSIAIVFDQPIASQVPYNLSANGLQLGPALFSSFHGAYAVYDPIYWSPAGPGPYPSGYQNFGIVIGWVNGLWYLVLGDSFYSGSYGGKNTFYPANSYLQIPHQPADGALSCLVISFNGTFTNSIDATFNGHSFTLDAGYAGKKPWLTNRVTDTFGTVTWSPLTVGHDLSYNSGLVPSGSSFVAGGNFLPFSDLKIHEIYVSSVTGSQNLYAAAKARFNKLP